MLKKLLKYDLKTMYKYLVFFYCLMLLCAGISRLLTTFGDSTFTYILAQIFAGTANGLAVGALINNSLHMWEYFKNNFYGDRSYLTHTLPIPISTLYLSKFITILLTCLSTLLVIILSLLILYGTPELFGQIHLAITQLGTGQIIYDVIVLALIIFLEILNIILSGITGIIIGFRSNSRKITKSIFYGLGFYCLANVFVVLVMLVGGLFNPRIMEIFTNTVEFNTSIINQLLTFGLIAYLFIIGVAYYLDLHFLKKGVNID